MSAAHDEPVELEAWYISSQSKGSYPTGNPDVHARSITAGSPFRVTKPAEIRFFNTLCKANPNGFLKKINPEEAEKLANSPSNSIISESKDEYIKRYTTATEEINSLKVSLDKYKSMISAKEQDLIVYKSKIEDISKKLVPQETLNAKIEELMNENEKLKQTIAKLNKKIQKQSEEVK